MKHPTPFLIGVVLGGTAVCGVFVLSMHRTPATPELRSPTAIKVTVYPQEGAGGICGVPVEIPPEKLDLAFRLLTPEAYFEGGVHDFITPIVAEAVITHADGTQTPVLVREHGHNPAVVSVDGKNYFYARNDPDIRAGAAQLIRLVNEVAHNEKNVSQPKP